MLLIIPVQRVNVCVRTHAYIVSSYVGSLPLQDRQPFSNLIFSRTHIRAHARAHTCTCARTPDYILGKQ